MSYLIYIVIPALHQQRQYFIVATQNVLRLGFEVPTLLLHCSNDVHATKNNDGSMLDDRHWIINVSIMLQQQLNDVHVMKNL